MGGCMLHGLLSLAGSGVWVGPGEVGGRVGEQDSLSHWRTRRCITQSAVLSNQCTHTWLMVGLHHNQYSGRAVMC